VFRFVVISMVVTAAAMQLPGCAASRPSASGNRPTAHSPALNQHAIIPVEERKPDEPLAAARFRYAQRLNEDGRIPPDALLNAKRQRDKMIAAQSENAPGARSLASAATMAWTWMGPGNIGGRIRAIVIHPTQPNIMWIGSASGGIWKTTNAGALWFPLDDLLPSLSIGCMAIDPSNPDVLLAGTGEGFFETVEGTSNTAAIRGAGMFRSIDGGATWAQIPSTAGPDFYFVNRIAIHPNAPQTILAGTSAGVFRSADGGTSWTLVQRGLCYDVQFHPTSPLHAVAGFHASSPMFSIDGGQSWNAATGAFGHRVELRYAPSQPNIVYASVSNFDFSTSDDRIRIHRSNDGGQTYTLQTTGAAVINTYQSYNNVLWVDPANPQTLLIGGVRLHRSIDGGVTTPFSFQGIHADHHVIVSHPSYNGSTNRVIFVGTDGGIYRIDDPYASGVAALNNNLGITQFYGAAINPTSGVILGGSQDNGTVRLARGATPQQWTTLAGGDGGFCAADPTDPNYFYGEFQRLAIFRSTNAGAGNIVSYVYHGITDAFSLNCNFIPFFMLDPNEPQRMLAGGRRLWRSNNIKSQSPTWQVIKPSIEPPPNSPGGGRTPRAKAIANGQWARHDPPSDHFAENSPWNISTIAVAEGNPNIVWVGYNNGQVWKTANGTQPSPSWVRVDAGLNGPQLPGRWVSRIVIGRNDHNRVLVSLMGWAEDNIWRTLDGGDNWQLIAGSKGGGGSGAMPSVPVGALAQHRTQPQRLFAGTDIGMFASNNFGETWSALTDPQGPGMSPIDELVWKNDLTLMVVTHGRGIYLVEVPPLNPADVNADGHVNIDDLFAVILAWGACPPPTQFCAADNNQDGLVSIDDLFIVIMNWG
jgi:hypothetical protein